MCIGSDVDEKNTNISSRRTRDDTNHIKIGTKKYGNDVYVYFRRRSVPRSLQKINGKTWKEAAKDLGLSIPSLFILLNHSMKAGIIKEVRIR
jgi:hypothetical protein